MTNVGSPVSEGVGRARGDECGPCPGPAGRAPREREVAMRFVLRLMFAGICCVLVAVSGIAWLSGWERSGKIPQTVGGPSETAGSAANIGLETFPDPNAPGTSAE